MASGVRPRLILILDRGRDEATRDAAVAVGLVANNVHASVSTTPPLCDTVGGCYLGSTACNPQHSITMALAKSDGVSKPQAREWRGAGSRLVGFFVRGYACAALISSYCRIQSGSASLHPLTRNSAEPHSIPRRDRGECTQEDIHSAVWTDDSGCMHCSCPCRSLRSPRFNRCTANLAACPLLTPPPTCISSTSTVTAISAVGISLTLPDRLHPFLYRLPPA